MKSLYITLFFFLAAFPFIAKACSIDLTAKPLPVDKETYTARALDLDAHHEQGLNQIIQDLADLHSRLQTSSINEIENHPRISISGDWNQACLVNLMTLIQNQGLNRKLFNEGAITSLEMMLNLVDVFTAPFSTLKRFLTSEVVEKILLEAIRSDNPEETLKEKLEEIAKENGVSLPEGAEGERLLKQMEQLMELYQLARQNATLPDDAKWNSWDFDPGRSTLDDIVPDFISSPDRVIPSQAMARFGTVDPDDSPVEDNSDGKGLTLQRVVMMGVAESPYPASANCQGQIQDYQITINNYGHVDSSGRFISDYIEYEIELNCCDEDEGDISYEGYGTEPISYFPGEDYPLLVGGSLGYGRQSGDNLFCAGISGQYYPDLPVGPCGAQPGVGLNLKYDYSGFKEDTYSFRNSNVIIEPQLLLQSHILPNLNLISGVSLPIRFGNQQSEFNGVVDKQKTSGLGASLITGLSFELPEWHIQLQTDVLGWQRQTISDPGSSGGNSTSSDWKIGLNKANVIDLIVARRLEAF